MFNTVEYDSAAKAVSNYRNSSAAEIVKFIKSRLNVKWNTTKLSVLEEILIHLAYTLYQMNEVYHISN